MLFESLVVQFHDEEGMPTQLEETFVHADPVELQDLGPGSAHLFFHGIAWSYVSGRSR